MNRYAIIIISYIIIGIIVIYLIAVSQRKAKTLSATRRELTRKNIELFKIQNPTSERKRILDEMRRQPVNLNLAREPMNQPDTYYEPPVSQSRNIYTDIPHYGGYVPHVASSGSENFYMKEPRIVSRFSKKYRDNHQNNRNGPRRTVFTGYRNI